MDEFARQLDQTFRREIQDTVLEIKSVTLRGRKDPAHTFSRDDVGEFYKTHNPTKVDSVPTLLRKYGHDLVNLQDTLHRKYGLDTLNCTKSARLRAIASHELEAYYRRRSEEAKIPGINAVVDKYEAKQGLPGLIQHVCASTTATASEHGAKSKEAPKPGDTVRGDATTTESHTRSDAQKATTSESSPAESANDPTQPDASRRPAIRKKPTTWQMFTSAANKLFLPTPNEQRARQAGAGVNAAETGNVKYNRELRLGAGFNMKTTAAIQRLYWQRRRLDDSLGRCDAAATRLHAAMM